MNKNNKELNLSINELNRFNKIKYKNDDYLRVMRRENLVKFHNLGPSSSKPLAKYYKNKQIPIHIRLATYILRKSLILCFDKQYYFDIKLFNKGIHETDGHLASIFNCSISGIQYALSILRSDDCGIIRKTILNPIITSDGKFKGFERTMYMDAKKVMFFFSSISQNGRLKNRSITKFLTYINVKIIFPILFI